VTLQWSDQELGAVAERVAQLVAAHLADSATAPAREWMNLTQLARSLGKGRGVVSRWHKNGVIPSVELPDGTIAFYYPSVTAALLSRSDSNTRRSA